MIRFSLGLAGCCCDRSTASYILQSLHCDARRDDAPSGDRRAWRSVEPRRSAVQPVHREARSGGLYMYRISRGYRDTPHRTSSTNVRRDAVGKPNFVFSKRKLHFQQRSPSSDSLLYGYKIRYRVSYIEIWHRC